MTRILHVTPSYIPAYVYGGPTLSVSRLAEALAHDNQIVETITTAANGAKELDVTIGVPHVIDGVICTYFTRWSKDHSHFSPGLLWEFYKQIKKGDVIIHIHSWWNLVVIPVVLICRLIGKRPILSPRGMLSPYTLQSTSKRWFHHLIGRWLLKGTILHATSKQEADQALVLIPNWPHFILPNIIDLPKLDTFSSNRSGSAIFQLITLSRIHPVKGFESLLKALMSLDLPWYLRIVGDGKPEYIAELQELTHKYGIADHIEWLGWRHGNEKFQLLANSDLFVLPSQSENFANVVIEALSVGTPVLLSAQVGLSDYVSTKGLGWIYSGTVDQLSNCIKSAQLDNSKREDIRLNAPNIINLDFSPATLAKQYLNAYRQFF